ncbi:MAG: S-methyl-5'-thioadenosine phosphorylase [Deltaproteobacteria bacterium]|nr:S-methyl-5'-thioadenosine phosphorylase [Deltaproteobacteria bacterium]
MSKTKLGIIGGSGLYEIEGLKNIQEVRVKTPFGNPSAPYISGKIGDVEVCFLPRHGAGHVFSPTEINYQANIYGFKKLGVNTLISFSAVGSMKKNIKPGDFVIVDQFIDRTRYRKSTFFEGGCVAHVSLADPVCPSLKKVLSQSISTSGISLHDRGTYICIEGPQFSTRAESHLYQSWGVDVIGMTNLPEARLAREAELCYGSVAQVTDYDCWNEEHDAVDAGTVLKVIKQNVHYAKQAIQKIVLDPRLRGDDKGKIGDDFSKKCTCRKALQFAIVSNRVSLSKETQKKLDLFLKKNKKG